MDLVKHIKSLIIDRAIHKTNPGFVVPGTYISRAFMILVILFTGLFVSGQVKFTTVINSKEIGRGEYLQIEFYVENAKEIDQMTPPDFSGFQVVGGPVQSSGMSIVNGNMNQYKSLSFVLQPTRTGKFTIGGASAVVNGKHMQSNSVTVTVTAASTGAGSARPGGGAGSGGRNPFPSMNWPDPFAGSNPMDVDRDYVLKPGENVKDKIKKNLFLKVDVNKTSCYVGEPIVATYKIYSRLTAESKVTRRPSLNGFSVYDMVDPNTEVGSVERLNGKDYAVHTIRKTQLIPLQPGNIDLDPMEVENIVHFVKGTKPEHATRHNGNPMQDLFDQLDEEQSMGPEIDENVTLSTKPVTITVKPLPEENKPAGYTGAVGTFSIQASLANRNISAQDEATLHVVIRGKGNLPVITAPQVAWPASVEPFDPTAKEDINKTVAPMSGAKSFDYIFTPKNPGHYVIPAINFEYFDPASQSYKMAGTDPIDFQVMAGAKRKQSSPAVNASGAAPAAREEPGQLKKLVQDHLEWIFAVLILSGVAVYLWRQNIRLRKTEQEQKEAAEKKAAEEELAEKARGSLAAAAAATAPLVDPLQEVKQLFGQGDYKGFYRELNRVIWKSLSAKLALPASELNKLNITRQLQSKGWDSPDILSLENILNECEMSLYTPSYDTYNMQLLLRQAESVISKLA